jgi:hypothetical protein
MRLESIQPPNPFQTEYEGSIPFTVRLCGQIFEVKSFTRSWLTTGFMIA